MLRTKQRLLKLQYMMLDVFILQICNMLCGHLFKKIFMLQISSSLKGTFFNLVATVFCVVFFILFNVYNQDISANRLNFKKLFKINFIMIISTFLSEALVLLVNNNNGMTTYYLGVYCILAIVLLVSGRLVMVFFISAFNDSYSSKVMLVGSGLGIENYYEYAKQYDFIFYGIVGYIDSEKKPTMEQKKIKYYGDFSQLNNIIKNNVIDEVVIDNSLLHLDVIKQFMRQCRDMGVVVLATLEPYLSDFDSWQKTIISDVPAIKYSIAKLNSGQLFIKRIMDIVGGMVGCVLVLISFIILAPLIKLESKGPVLFRQIRVGKNGRKFKILKYRTMYNDAEQRKKELMKDNKMKGHMFKVDDDPRITKIGKFLRKTSIDELPQFINVLIGDMSLVGTRPPTVDEVNEYENRHFIRLSIIPGITGNWQVSGRSDIVDFEQVVEMDKEYIVNWTIFEDIRIMLKTIGVLFKKKGAY